MRGSGAIWVRQVGDKRPAASSATEETGQPSGMGKLYSWDAIYRAKGWAYNVAPNQSVDLAHPDMREAVFRIGD